MPEKFEIITQIRPPDNVLEMGRPGGRRDMTVICDDAANFLVSTMHMPEDVVAKEMGFAYQIFSKNKQLMECTPVSLYYALANIGNMGLTLNPAQKMAYLVPRKNKGQMECCLTPSYMGLIKLCTDPGGVLVIEAGVLMDGDVYDMQLGSGGYIKHRPLEMIPRSKMSADQRELVNKRWKGDANWKTIEEHVVGVYSRAVLHNGAESIDWMPIERLIKIKRLMVRTTRDDSPSNLWPEEWMKKTVIAHHTKTLPKSDRTALAVEMFQNAEGVYGQDGKLVEHSERSILGQLSDGLEAESICPTCEEKTTGGICRNIQCPEAIPPEAQP